MTLTRRTAALSLTAGLVAGCATTPMRSAARKPLIIAHRGASGERPEHTMLAYRHAIDQGADIIEPDLVATKDGVLICRHENEISGTTDVGTIPKWASRKTTKTVDGQAITGWFAEDFTWAEIQELGARERLPDLRPNNDRANGFQLLPSFQEVIDVAKQQSALKGRPIGIYPEMKHPTYLKTQGFDLVEMLLEALKRNNLPSRAVPVYIQCFEAEPLKRVKGRTRADIVQLTGGREMLTPAGLKEVATYATGIGPDKGLLSAELVRNVHAAGLIIHPYTFRAENAFLPAELRRGADRAAHGDIETDIRRALDMGVDGLFSDFPGIAVKVRDEWVAARG